MKKAKASGPDQTPPRGELIIRRMFTAPGVPPEDSKEGTMIYIRHLGAATETLREAQVDLAHVDRITTIGRLTASIAPEVTQPIAAIVTNAQAARRFLNRRLPDLDEVRQALDCIVRDAYRASDVIYRIRGLRPLQGGTTEEGARGDHWSDLRRAQADA